MTAKRILIIYAYTGDWDKLRLSIKQHLTTLENSPYFHHIDYYNALEDAPQYSINAEDNTAPPKNLALDQYDVIVIHNTFLGYRWTDWYFYKWKRRFSWINGLQCQKIAVPQDEFDHSGILDEWLLELGVTDVFSRYDPENMDGLYPIMRNYAAFRKCLPGYIDDNFAHKIEPELMPIQQRPVDIAYRARHLPYWFGHFGQIKQQVAKEVVPLAKSKNLIVDISTDIEDTIVGKGWLHFLANSKATLGCEGGSSAIDWRGELRVLINQVLASDPNIDFQTLSAQLPDGWDRYRFATLTPRHFESIITKTCQILVDGHYSGILKPNIHYLSIKPDFSNLDEVLELIKNPELLEEITERAYQQIYLEGHYTYKDFCKLFDSAMSDYERRLQENSMGTQSPVIILERVLASERQNNNLLQAQYQQQIESLAQEVKHLSNSINQLRTIDTAYQELSMSIDNLRQTHKNLSDQTVQIAESIEKIEGHCTSKSFDGLFDSAVSDPDHKLQGSSVDPNTPVSVLERVLASERQNNALFQSQHFQQIESLAHELKHLSDSINQLQTINTTYQELSMSIDNLRQSQKNLAESIEKINANAFQSKRQIILFMLVLETLTAILFIASRL